MDDDFLDSFWIVLMSLLMFVTAPASGWILVLALGLYGVLSLLIALAEVAE